jgi:hypothetical protein
MKDEATRKELVGGFFAEYWDDNIVFGCQKEVAINARTMRVLKCVFWVPLIAECLQHWEMEETIQLLGDADDLEPDAPCVLVKGYVSNLGK